MRKARTTRIIATVSRVLILFLVACAPDREAARDIRTPAPPVVDLSMTDGAFRAPDTLDAGMATFRFINHGDEIHYAHAVRLDSSRTVPEFLAAYAQAVRTAGPRPTYVTRSGGPGGTAPGDTSVVTHIIEPGHYVWICPVDDETGTPHFARGEARTFVVRAAAPNAVAVSTPKATGVIRLINYGFTLDAPLKAGHHTLHVVNEGPDPHDLVMVKLAAGTTLDDLRSWLREPNGPPPFTPAGGVAVLAPKMEAYFETELTPGDYALFCMATAQDGRTHIEHGMTEQIRVGGA
jgi:hypothetical protein